METLLQPARVAVNLLCFAVYVSFYMYPWLRFLSPYLVLNVYPSTDHGTVTWPMKNERKIERHNSNEALLSLGQVTCAEPHHSPKEGRVCVCVCVWQSTSQLRK